jgi:DNA-binding XRE family transcriptional regulator
MPAQKGNQYAKGNKGGGRRPKYKADYAEQAFKYCLLGATDEQLAELFDVTEQTINQWKKDHNEFFLALKRGKVEADARVSHSLYSKANGYSHPDTDIRVIDDKIVMTPITKHYAPDTTAAIFWLKNRQPKIWRDKQEVEGTITGNINLSFDKQDEQIGNETAD